MLLFPANFNDSVLFQFIKTCLFFSSIYPTICFSLFQSIFLSLSLSPTPSALFQHLHVNVSNEPYILQKPSALSWCGDDVTSLSSLEISSVTLTPVSSPDSSQSASLLTPPPAKPTHSQPTSGYIMPRPRVNVSYTTKLHSALCMWFNYKCSYFKQEIVHPKKSYFAECLDFSILWKIMRTQRYHKSGYLFIMQSSETIG